MPKRPRTFRENRTENRAAAGKSPRARRASPRRTHISVEPLALPPGLSPRKLPRQARARDTVAAILEAAIELFSSQGFADTSTNQVARRAGVSVGSLYQYFPNKDALVVALFERHLQEVEAVIAGSLASFGNPAVPMRTAMREMLEALGALHDRDPRLAQAADPHSAGARAGDQLLRKREERFRGYLTEILESRPDVRPGNRPLMAILLYEIVETMSRALMHGDARRFPRDLAFAEATEAICRYIE
jgi:AcrR family transcriptional regulator